MTLRIRTGHRIWMIGLTFCQAADRAICDLTIPSLIPRTLGHLPAARTPSPSSTPTHILFHVGHSPTLPCTVLLISRATSALHVYFIGSLRWYYVAVTPDGIGPQVKVQWIKQAFSRKAEGYVVPRWVSAGESALFLLCAGDSFSSIAPRWTTRKNP